jgi:hypothetical protein
LLHALPSKAWLAVCSQVKLGNNGKVDFSLLHFDNKTFAGRTDAVNIKNRLALQRHIGQLLTVSEIQFGDLAVCWQQLIEEIRQ